jgi:hypothetical protein
LAASRGRSSAHKLGVRRDAVTDEIVHKAAKAHHIGHPGKRLGLDLGLDDRVARTQARRSRRQFGLLGRRIAQGDFGIEPAQNGEDLRLLDAVEEVLSTGPPVLGHIDPDLGAQAALERKRACRWQGWP